MSQYLKSAAEEAENRLKAHHNLFCAPDEILPYENTEFLKAVNETINILKH